MRKPLVKAAVLAGMVESLSALELVPAVFPGEPGESFDRDGTAWISGAKSTFKVRGLGPHVSNHVEEVEVQVSFSAYCESGSAVQAGEDADARVSEMADAVVDWLLRHVDLNDTCTHCLIGDVEDFPHEAESGWVQLSRLTVTATCHPPFTG